MKRNFFSLVLAVAIASAFIFSAVSINAQNENPSLIPSNFDGQNDFSILSYQIYDTWGPVIICLGAVMFGAIIAGIAISKEDIEWEGGEP